MAYHFGKDPELNIMLKGISAVLDSLRCYLRGCLLVFPSPVGSLPFRNNAQNPVPAQISYSEIWSNRGCNPNQLFLVSTSQILRTDMILPREVVVYVTPKEQGQQHHQCSKFADS